MVGLMATFSKRLMPYASLLHPEPLTLWQSTADPSSAGGTQTQFYLRLSGVSGSQCTQGLFEPFENLWRVWGLILNTILSLLLSCWGFSCDLGCGVSLQSRSSAVQPPLQHPSPCWGFSARGRGQLLTVAGLGKTNKGKCLLDYSQTESREFLIINGVCYKI